MNNKNLYCRYQHSSMPIDMEAHLKLRFHLRSLFSALNENSTPLVTIPEWIMIIFSDNVLPETTENKAKLLLLLYSKLVDVGNKTYGN